MPVTWNSDANEKLLFGLIAQMKRMNVKLDYKELAAYMDCTAAAVQLHLSRLRRQVEGSNSAESTPNTSPKKRKTTKEPKTPTKRGKGKKAGLEEDMDFTKEEDAADSKMEVKEEAGLDFDYAL